MFWTFGDCSSLSNYLNKSQRRCTQTAHCLQTGIDRCDWARVRVETTFGKHSVDRPVALWTDDLNKVANIGWMRSGQDQDGRRSLREAYIQLWTVTGWWWITSHGNNFKFIFAGCLTINGRCMNSVMLTLLAFIPAVKMSWM